jgi:3-oxoacyl-[acyl-carrier protein] reductase
MPNQFENKTVIVTGAGRGIGAKTAFEFAKKGVKVACISKTTNCQEIAKKIQEAGYKASAYQCDVINPTEIKDTISQVIKDFSSVDILINNAGIKSQDKLTMAVEVDDWDRVVNVNLRAYYLFIKYTMPIMIKQRHGRIINISSILGITGRPGQVAYTTSKAGIFGLTKTVAQETARRNITCNAITPGFIETDMNSDIPDELVSSIKASIPAKKFGKPNDIAKLAIFLASEDAGYITGQVFGVDGGLVLSSF